LLLSVFLCSCSDDDDGPGNDACSLLRSANIQNVNGGAVPRIIDGTLCSVDRSPVVEITLLVDDGNISVCTGTLLTSRQVLTAAHCYEEEFSGIIVSSSALVEGVDVPIVRVTTHPDVNIPQNDVAILELERDVATNPFPLIISTPLEVGSIISIFGYGVDEKGDFGALRSGEMEVTGITSQVIVARFSGQGSNICFGDSGGPALLTTSNGVSGIVGVTSFGTTAQCSEDGLAAFANVQSEAILNFILDEVPESVVL